MPSVYGGVLWCHNCSTAPDQGPDGGLAPVESQQHLEICKAYLHLHQGRDVENDFKDKVNFFMDVMMERTKSKYVKQHQGFPAGSAQLFQKLLGMPN